MVRLTIRERVMIDSHPLWMIAGSGLLKLREGDPRLGTMVWRHNPDGSSEFVGPLATLVEGGRARNSCVGLH